MRQHIARWSAVAVLTVVVATAANAQVFNQPVYVSPKHGTGLSIAFDYGKGLNTNSGKLKAYGGRATLGFAMINVSAGVSSVDLGATSEISYGALASVNVISAPLVPIGISIFGGFGTIDPGGGSIKNYPIGVAIAVKPPTPGLGIEIWAAPRVNIVNDGTDTDTDFAVSGGLNLDLPMGLGIHAALDYVAKDNEELLFGAGLHYKFVIPGLGL